MRVPPALLAAAVLATAALPAFAQVSGHEWHKSYTVSATPTLSVETGDSSLEIQPCASCSEIRIAVQSDRGLDHYRLEEHQNGDHVYFTLKEKPQIGFHMNRGPERTAVTVQTPAHLTLDAHTSDGNLAAHGLTGSLAIQSGDGHVTLDDVHGDLSVHSSDGNVDIHSASGTLQAHNSDGQMSVEGAFSAVQMRTSDGNLHLTLAPGSRLTTASSLQSSDGQVLLTVPPAFAADLSISASDGHIDCNLPLTLDHYDSGHAVHGQLNGGTIPLTIHTSDGNVRIAQS